MTARRDRSLQDLYGATKRIPEPEITPVLQGLYRFQGPVDELEGDPQVTNSALEENRFPFVNQNIASRPKSGTCNVCSAPCSVCLHFNQTSTAMESKFEMGPSDNAVKKEEDSSSFIGSNEPLHKKLIDDRQYASSEASNVLYSVSNHVSRLDNVEKAAFKVSVAKGPDQSDHKSPGPFSDEATGDDGFLLEKTTILCSFSPSKSCASPGADEQVLEKLSLEHCCSENKDDILGISAVKEVCISALPHVVGINEEETSTTSTSTNNLLANKVEKVVKTEEAADYHSEEREACHVHLKSNTHYRKHSQDKTCGLNSPAVGFTQTVDYAEFPSSIIPATDFPCPRSQNGHSFPQAAPKGMGGNLTCQLPAEASESSMGHHEFSLAGNLADTRIAMKSPAASLIDEGNKSNSTSKPVTYSKDVDGFVIEISTENKVQSENAVNCDLIDDECRKPNTLLDASSNQVSEACQRTSESKSSEEMEDDVKVCDICGDMGQEELLAVCTRCSDGAEHTYCMHVMLDKVPEDDWLCEGCQLEEESGKQKMDKTRAENEALEEALSSDGKPEKHQHTSKPKGLPNEKETANEAVQITHISAKKSDENVDDASLSRQKISELNHGLKEPADSRKRTLLTRDSTFSYMDVEKTKQVGAPNPSGIQVLPTRVPLSKSTSFNNSKVPKVKQLINDIPQKPKNMKESISGNLRKGALDTKSASFKNVNSFSYNDVGSKLKSSDTSLAELPRGEKQANERNMLGSKTSSILGHPSNTIGPIASTSVASPKRDVEAVQNNAKTSHITDITHTSNAGIGQGSDTGAFLGHSEFKKPHIAKSDGITLLNGLSKHVDQKAGQLASKGNVTTTSSVGLRHLASSANRSLRCQKCNEAGHAAQFCVVDKVRMAALKPLAEQNPKDRIDKKNKLKESVEAANLTTITLVGAGSSDWSEKHKKSGFDRNHEVGSEAFLPGSLCSVRNLCSHDGTTGGSERRESVAYPSKGSYGIDTMHNNQRPEETSASRERDADANRSMSDEFKPKMQICSSHASVIVDEFRALIIPKPEHVWLGGFEVLSKGRDPELCHGVQAHLPSCVSPKVLQAVARFPSTIQLEEVPRQNSWPSHFEENGPKEDHIALFFFASDFESYEKNYSKLLINMFKNDLALRRDIDGVELLVFPSNLLPQNSQRWNSLYFLWGVFKVKRQNCSEDLPDHRLKQDIMDPDQPTSATSIVSAPHGPQCCESVDKEAVNCGRLPETSHLESTNPGLHGIPSSEPGRHICDENQFSVQESLHQAGTNNISCSILQRDSLKYRSQTPSFLSIHSPSVHQMAKEQLLLNTNISLQENFSSKDGGDVGNLPRGREGVQVNSIDRVPPFCSVSSNYRDNESASEEENKVEDGLVESEPTLDVGSEDLMDIDTSNSNKGNTADNHFRSEVISDDLSKDLAATVPFRMDLRSKRKHGNPGSTEQLSQVSDLSSLNDNTVHKKIKLESEYKEDTVDGRLASKSYPLTPSYGDDAADNEMAANLSTSADRCFFPTDLGPAKSQKIEAQETFINVLSSDDYESPQCGAPDLELALGDNKKTVKKAVLPFLSPKAGEKSQQAPAPSAGDANDAAASLSLSLAFPASDKTRASKPSSRTEKHLSVWQL